MGLSLPRARDVPARRLSLAVAQGSVEELAEPCARSGRPPDRSASRRVQNQISRGTRSLHAASNSPSFRPRHDAVRRTATHARQGNGERLCLRGCRQSMKTEAARCWANLSGDSSLCRVGVPDHQGESRHTTAHTGVFGSDHRGCRRRQPAHPIHVARVVRGEKARPSTISSGRAPSSPRDQGLELPLSSPRSTAPPASPWRPAGVSTFTRIRLSFNSASHDAGVGLAARP